MSTTIDSDSESEPSTYISTYLRTALRHAENTEFDEGLKSFHVALIVKGGRILSYGHNRLKTHTMATLPLKNRKERLDMYDYAMTLHAEMDAIRKIRHKDRLKGSRIYVVRLRKNGEPAMSCPCNLCQHYIEKYGIKTAYFTTDNGEDFVRAA